MEFRHGKFVGAGSDNDLRSVEKLWELHRSDTYRNAPESRQLMTLHLYSGKGGGQCVE